MNADLIIFDKDGTLIDFDAFWVTISEHAIADILGQLGRTDIPMTEILKTLGVYDGVTDVQSVLCQGTYAQMSAEIHRALTENGVSIDPSVLTPLVTQAYGKHADTGVVKPTGEGLAKTLAALKAQGKRLAVVTTDNEPMTRKCLKALGVEPLFDRIFTDDGKTPTKPDPFCAQALSLEFDVPTDRILMVGDTMTDVAFAKNAGIRMVGIAKSERNRAVLAPHVCAVINDPSELPSLLEADE